MNNALLALADAAAKLSDDESVNKAGSPPPSDGTASHSPSSPVTNHEGKPAVKPSADRRPAKKRYVPPEALVESPTVEAAHQPAFQQLMRQHEAAADSSAPMPLSILPKKKRKKRADDQHHADFQSQYLATSWYFNESTFPVTLMAIMESQGASPCITFLSDNQRFVIVDPARLENEIFPKHFELRTPTLEQFSEMLLLWGFTKNVDETFPNVSVYKHDMFKKGDWEQCLKISMPIGSLEKLTKIELEAAKTNPSNLGKSRPRKRQRRGNGVPLPPPELVANTSVPCPRRITQEVSGPAYSQLAQILQLNKSVKPQQQPLTELLQKNSLLRRRISVETNTNPFAETFLERSSSNPLPSSVDVAIASKTKDVVAAAIHAMKQGNANGGPAAALSSADLRPRRATIDHGSLKRTQLDVMTENFLARSKARLSRSVGAVGAAAMVSAAPVLPGPGPSLSGSRLQIEAMLAAQQKLGNISVLSLLSAAQR